MTAQTFESLADVLPEPMLLVTANGRIVAANQPMRQMLGARFIHGREYDVTEIFRGPREQITEYLKLCSGVRQFIPGALKLRVYPGVELDLQCEGAAINDANSPDQPIVLRLKAKLAAGDELHGLNAQVASLNREIGERIKVEEINRWMTAIVESSSDAIISKDLNGIIISCNPGASHLFGYTAQELVGQPMTLLIPLEHQDEEQEILRRIRRGERVEHFETIRQRKDGSLIEVSLTISPVKDAEGKIIGASKIARDITERKQVEQKLTESFQREKAARELAEAANHAKDDFLASLSHELRTPLNPVLLIASDAADDPNLPPAVRHNFETIRKNIELEARLIDDLLDLTRITYGKLLLHSRVSDAQAVLQEAIRNIQLDLNDKQIRLGLVLQQSPIPVYCDEVRLQQVFWNVLKNAVKFTPPNGEIAVETSLINGQVNVTVTDTGIGMTPEEIGRIFDAFSQGDHVGNASHRFGGLGLGLAISRRLIEMHSGRILARSAGRDKGSTFVIELPLAKQENHALPPDKTFVVESVTPAMSRRNASILLVEDHEPTRVALRNLLTRRAYRVRTAGNIAEALDISASDKFDFIISDIGLPDGNGNHLMMELSGRYGLKGIALTGYGMEQDVEQSRASGFVTHLIKPVTVRSLENALEEFKD